MSLSPLTHSFIHSTIQPMCVGILISYVCYVLVDDYERTCGRDEKSGE